MHRRLISIALLLLCMLLPACTKPEDLTPSSASEELPNSSASDETEAQTSSLPDSSSDVETEESTASSTQTVSTYRVLEGTPEENTVTVIQSDKEGPTVYIVGGIHGNEVAGWTAAEALKSELRIGCGTVYIWAPVNRSGAEANTRNLVNAGNVNRAFPGNVNSEDLAEKVAGTLFSEIQRTTPVLALDLHEAQAEVGQGPTNAGVGNSLIYTLDDPIADLLFDFIIANESGQVAHRKFALTAPGVATSFNRVVSEELGIPVITVETLRTLELEDRVRDQKEIVLFCLNHLGMTAWLQP